MAALSGQCLCGSVTYNSPAEPVLTVLCHCADCQRQSGAAFSTNLVAPREGFEIRGDDLSEFETIGTDTKQPVRRMFCSKCGSPLVSLAESNPDLVIIKSGTLDDKSVVSPAMEIWTSSAQDWVEHASDRRHFKRSPG